MTIATNAFAALLARLEKHFVRSEPRNSCATFLRGLLSHIVRKNGWGIAEAIGDPTPYRVQSFLSRHQWDPDAVRDELQAYVVENFGEVDGTFVGDETGFLKKGEHSAGVQRQYTGTAGGVVNCQIGVFLGYAASRGATLIDRALYMPQQWIEDRERCRKARVPDTVDFQTKPQMLITMIKDALKRGVPARWVVADEVYGNNGVLRKELEHINLSYVLTIPKTHRLPISCKVEARDVAAWWPSDQWKRYSAGDGTKGPRLYDWVYRTLPSAPPGWERGLLIRRNIKVGAPTSPPIKGPEKPDEPDLTYFLTFAPIGTPLEKLVQVAGTRWTIETSFKITKNEVGLDHYEVRSWTGWYRHITMAMLAFAHLTVVRNQLNDSEHESGSIAEGSESVLGTPSAELPRECEATPLSDSSHDSVETPEAGSFISDQTTQEPQKKNAAPANTLLADLILWSVPEVRRLIARMLSALSACSRSMEAVLESILVWSRWRRRHQKIARESHWKHRTGSPAPALRSG